MARLSYNSQKETPSIQITGIDSLKQLFNKTQEFGFDLILVKGERDYIVKHVHDDYLDCVVKGQDEKIPYNYLTDRWGDIFYFLAKKEKEEVFISFDFTDDEKERYPKEDSPEGLAMDDFADIVSPDEQELYESKSKKAMNIKQFIAEEIKKLHKKTLLEQKKSEIIKKINLLENDDTENNSTDSLERWKELMEKNDLQYFKEFQQKTKLELEQIRENWKALRRNALQRLNQKLQDSGKKGKLFNIDVSDDELYDYLNSDDAALFFKYSRILDFAHGYKPKNMIVFNKNKQ